MINPYILPEGNVQIAFSGGRSSGYMLHQILDANGGLPDRAKVIFTNTGREFNETLDFVQECSDRWNVPIKWIEYRRRGNQNWYEVVNHNSASRNGEPFEALIRTRATLPNIISRYCTAELKLRCSAKYLRAECGWKRWTVTLGMRYDEKQRLKQPKEGKFLKAVFPLAEARAEKADVVAFWKRQPFDLRLENVNGKTPRGNCDCCFLKSEATQAAVARDYPERFAAWERMEEFMRPRAGGGQGGRFNEKFSKKELREFVERQGDWIFDSEDYLCQKDDGECAI